MSPFAHVSIFGVGEKFTKVVCCKILRLSSDIMSSVDQIFSECDVSQKTHMESIVTPTIPNPTSLVFDVIAWETRFKPGRKGKSKNDHEHKRLVGTTGAMDPRVLGHETTAKMIYNIGVVISALARALDLDTVISETFYGDAALTFFHQYRAADVAAGKLAATSRHRWIDAATVTRKIDAPLAMAIKLRLDAEQLADDENDGAIADDDVDLVVGRVTTQEREWYRRWKRVDDMLESMKAEKRAHDDSVSTKSKDLPDQRLSDPVVLDRAIAGLQGDCKTGYREILTAHRRLIAHFPNHPITGKLSSGEEYELALDNRTPSEAARLVNEAGIPETNYYDPVNETVTLFARKTGAGANGKKRGAAGPPMVLQCAGTLFGGCLTDCNRLAGKYESMYLLFDPHDPRIGRTPDTIDDIRRRVLKAACNELEIEPSEANLGVHRKRGEGTKQLQELRLAHPNNEQELCRIGESVRDHGANQSVAGTYNAPIKTESDDTVATSAKRSADPDESDDPPMPKRKRCQRTSVEIRAAIEAEMARHQATVSSLLAELGRETK